MNKILDQLINEAGERDPFLPLKSEERSGADRLRPPYPTPVPGGTPATAGASRVAEVGFNGLPPEYQRALLQSPLMQTLIGLMPSGYNIKGLTDLKDGTMLAETPRIMQHELVHEWLRRSPVKKTSDGLTARTPLEHLEFPNVEEALAQRVGPDLRVTPQSQWAQDRATEADKAVREKYPETKAASSTPSSLGLIQAILQYLGVK